MGVVRSDSKSVEIGWTGKMKNIAENMRDGVPGDMLVRNKKIKGFYSGLRNARKDGHEYVRVNNDGKWITRQAGGGKIRVHPRKRNFFYLTKAQEKGVSAEMSEWVEKLIAKEGLR